MTQKQYTKVILHCNQECGNFYHNYDDGENCWCNKLNKMVAEAGPADVMNDYTSREIPKECPLNDDTLNLLKQFFEIEIKYIDKIYKSKPIAHQKHLTCRRMLMVNIVNLCNECQTEEGVDQIKNYIKAHKND